MNIKKYMPGMLLPLVVMSVSAQDMPRKYVDIPDKVLSDYLIENYDADGDKKISYEEAAQITSIGIYCEETDNGPAGCNVGSLKGIEAMPNLESIECENVPEAKTRIKEIDVSHNKKLKVLFIPGHDLATIDVSHNPELESLDITNSRVTSLDLSNNPNIQSLSIVSTKLRNVDISHLKNLQIFCCQDLQMEELDVSGLPNLMILYCANCGLKKLTFGKGQNLKGLSCESNEFTSLDMSGIKPENDPDSEGVDFNFTSNPNLKYIKVWDTFKEDAKNNMIVKDASTKFITPDGQEIKTGNKM